MPKPGDGMALIACWDGQRFELRDEAGELRSVIERNLQAKQDETPNMAERAESGMGDGVGTSVSALLLPAEQLLQRSFSLPLEHPRLIDVDMIQQELADQAGIEEGEWWPSWLAARVGDGVRGLVFALSQSLKDALHADAVGSQSPYIGPDIAIRLAARLPQEANAAALLDADAEGLMLGMFADGVWRGMRRLNLSAGRDKAVLAKEAWATLKAMGFDAASMPVAGRLDSAWQKAFVLTADIDWQVDTIKEGERLPDRHASNALAFAMLAAGQPFNFRHGAWRMQAGWGRQFGAWRRSVLLAASVCLLAMVHDAYQLHILRTSEHAARSGIEQAFHKALPNVAMVDPMLQLRQAAGGGSADAWRFVRHLDAIAKLGKKEAGFKVLSISYRSGEVLLTGMADDFAAANRIRDVLASILGSKVDLLDTDLNGKQVRIRLRWAA